jgi:hypothetical protein
VSLRRDRTVRMARASLASVAHMHNPQLADPVQAFIDREFSPSTARSRYDWIYEHDAMTVPV